MCVICAKPQGAKFPTMETFEAMWARNPHGAGFMYARDGKVFIRKGFMTLDDLLEAIEDSELKESESVVFHFRISTQAGITPTMTHPFPVSRNYRDMEALEATARIGFAHNGIIARTSCNSKRFSDTALFVTRYVSELLRKPDDVENFALLDAIEALAPNNRFAIMNGEGKIAFVGDFSKKNGCFYSNLYHEKSPEKWLEGRF